MRYLFVLVAVMANALALLVWWRQGASETQSAKGPLLCGHWAVMNGCMLSGVAVTADESRQLLPLNMKAHSFAELKRAFEAFGIEAVFQRDDYSGLSDGPHSRVVHLKDPDHFVVCFLKNERGLYCFDAMGKRILLRREELEQHWTGNTLKLQRRQNLGSPRKHASLQFAYLYHDVGDVADGTSEVEMRFPFVNTGLEPLTITQVDTSCSCIQASAPQEAILPGAAGMIAAKFRVSGTDRLVQTINVRSNDPVRSMIVLTASAGRAPWAKIFPESIQFGKVIVGDTKTVKVHVQLQHEQVRLRSANCASPQFAVVLEEITPKPASRNESSSSMNMRRAQYVMSISFSAAQLEQTERHAFAGNIVLHADREDCADVEIPIAATVVGAVNVFPKVLRLEDGREGRCMILSERGHDIEIIRTNAHRIGLVATVDAASNRHGASASLLVSRQRDADIAVESDLEIEVREASSGSSNTVQVRLPVRIGGKNGSDP